MSGAKTSALFEMLFRMFKKLIELKFVTSLRPFTGDFMKTIVLTLAVDSGQPGQ